MDTVSIRITDPSLTAEARRLGTELAATLGFGETAAGKVSIVLAEAATNLIKHADGGELLLTPLEGDGPTGLEILSLDKGPGMRDVDACMRDGFSTAGSMGTGLGAISRLVDTFDIYSSPGSGTVLVAQLWDKPRPEKKLAPTPFDLGAISVPMVGEEVCGDGWSILYEGSNAKIIVSDGLGHGPGAAEASTEAIRIFRNNPTFTPTEMIETMHAALRGTRGAAVAIAEFDAPNQVIRFCGAGNIAGTIVSRTDSPPHVRRNMVSHNGTIGHQIRKVQEFTYPWTRGDTLLLHSDGLISRWDLAKYAGLAKHKAAVTVGMLYRDYNRGRDDTTVVVMRQSEIVE